METVWEMEDRLNENTCIRNSNIQPCNQPGISDWFIIQLKQRIRNGRVLGLPTRQDRMQAIVIMKNFSETKDSMNRAKNKDEV